MLQEAVIVMTVLGCGDQTMNCDLVPRPDKTWETQAECNAAIPKVLTNITDASYPVLTAYCEIKFPPEPKQELVAEPQNSLEEQIFTEDETVAERTPVYVKVFDSLRTGGAVINSEIRESFDRLSDSTKRLVGKIKKVVTKY